MLSGLGNSSVNGSWISDGDVIKSIKAEVAAITKKLGHWMAGWSEHNGTLYNLCVTCHERVICNPRAAGKMRMRGLPIAMRCKKPDEITTPGWNPWVGCAGRTM